MGNTEMTKYMAAGAFQDLTSAKSSFDNSSNWLAGPAASGRYNCKLYGVGLVAAGGIAFDYARLASMDTELQDAADQAALAAASQLDGQSGACARAAAAASALVANRTMFANDNANATAINVQNESACDATGKVRFYQSYSSTTRMALTRTDSPAAIATQRQGRLCTG